MKHASALVSIEYSIADTQWQKGLPHNTDVHGNLYFYWIPVQWKLLCRRPIMLLFVCKTKLTALTPTFTACMLYVATMKPLCSACTQHCCKKPPRPLHPPHSPSQAIQCSACPVLWNTVLHFLRSSSSSSSFSCTREVLGLKSSFTAHICCKKHEHSAFIIVSNNLTWC